MRTRFLTTEPAQLEYYRGRLIHAGPRVHDDLAEVVRRVIPAGARVLDYGAGAGAFSLRLHDMGYHVVATDIDGSRWAVPEVPFYPINCGQSVLEAVGGERFEAVCCIEVIEHVENPWQLLRDLRSLISAGGVLLLSTPNISSFLSRLLFLRDGRFLQFGDADLAYGHIAPVSAWELEVAAERTGWRIREVSPAGYLPIIDLSGRRLRHLVANAARLVAHAVSRGHRAGYVLAFVFDAEGEEGANASPDA